MLKKLNQNGGPPVELSPGLDMGVRRRGPRTRAPKRTAQDQAVGGSVKRAPTKRRKGAGAEPQLKVPQSKEAQHKEAQPPEPQSAEPHVIQQPPTDQEKRISEADVAAASRLAQAAIAAGLTGTTSEAGTPVVEDPPCLVRFTKEDLRNILTEAVADARIQQKMEPHWLARTEFLTWWERPAADMHNIKVQVSRLAVRWSKDLQTQDPDDVDIPASILESWRTTEIVIGADPKEDTDEKEGNNEDGMTGVGNDGNQKERDKERDSTKENEIQTTEEQGDEKQEDEKQEDEEGVARDSHDVGEALAESVTLAVRDMLEWKEAFDKEMSAEPTFRSKRAWAARISESQIEATMLERKAWDLDVHKSKWATQSTMQAVQRLLDELQKFRVGIRMDREAFWDEFDQEGAERLAETTEMDQSTEVEMQEAVQKDDALDIVAETEDIQMTEFEAELEADLEDAEMMEIEELHGSSTGESDVPGVKPDPTKQPSDVANDDADSNIKTARPEHPSDGESRQEPFDPAHGEEPTPPSPARITDLQSEISISKAPESSTRSPIETCAGKEIISPRKEEKSEALVAAEFKQEDQEGQAAQAGEKLNGRESTPWLPDKRGSHSPSWKWPGDQKEGSEVADSDAIAAVEEDEEASQDTGRDTSSGLFSSRSASVEEVSNEEEHSADQDLTTSDKTGISQNTSSMTSKIQPEGIDEASSKVEGTRDQTLTTPDITRLPQETSPAASDKRSVSPELIICEVQNAADSSSSASNISSLPEDVASSPPGRSEAVEELKVEDAEDRASDAPDLREDTSLPKDTGPVTAGVRIESIEQDGAGAEDTVDSTSPASNIARLLEEVSLAQATSSSSTTGVPSRGVEEIGRVPKEEAADQTSTINLPQTTSPTATGIRSGGVAGVGGEVENTGGDHVATNLGAAGFPQGAGADEDMDAPPTVGIDDSRIAVPNVRYIKPQWEESLFSPEEPMYSVNDFSANEVDEEDDGDDIIDEADDREADDVDP